MNENLQLRLDELTDNPSARVPVCLALDTSSSMAGAKIQELNAGIQAFYSAVRSDEMAACSAEIAVVNFGEVAQQVLDFAGIERQRIPQFSAYGGTPMGAAVSLSLDMLDQAKRVYSQMGVDYFQPWLVLMTDGEPTDDISAAAQRCRELIERRKLTVFPVAIGRDANLATLAAFAPNLPALRIQSTDFGRFFAWLAKSINSASLSNPGDKAAASLGETAFRKVTVDWQTGFNR